MQFIKCQCDTEEPNACGQSVWDVTSHSWTAQCFVYVREALSVRTKRYLLEIIKIYLSKIVSEYDQEIPQSQTADNPLAPRGRAAQPSRDTRKTN